MRRVAWINLDRFSTAWVTCCPTEDLMVTDTEFVEITARYLGLPSPACVPLHGQRIGNTRQNVDEYGFRLCSLQLTGCTAIVCCLRPDDMVIANLGDSRAVSLPLMD